MTDVPLSHDWTLRRALGWATVSLVGFALAFGLRYGVIQPKEIGVLCGEVDAPGWCTPRQWLILWQHYNGWGWVAVVSAAIGLLVALPRPLLRIVLANALLFSALALALYNATHGAVALVLTLLALLRRR